jgi:hypothetical protein
VFRRVFKKCDKKLSKFVEQTIRLIYMTAAKNARGWSQEGPEWGIYKNIPYLLNVEHAKTNYSLFAFGASHELLRGKKYVERIVSRLIKECKDKSGVECVVSTSELWKKLSDNYWWKKYLFIRVLGKAKRYEKELMEEKKKGAVKEKVSPKYFRKEGEEETEKLSKPKMRLGRNDQRDTCRQVVRALATLELVLKDVDSNVVVRRDEKKDFVAALKLIEKVVLPTYFHVIFEQDLFDDYNLVLPIFGNST